MNEQRRQILQMLAVGDITADDAEKLIDALERQQPEAPEPESAAPGPRPKYLRVLVDEPPREGKEAGRVNVRVPLKLLHAGVRLTSLLPPKAASRISTELNNKGIPLDLGALKPEQIDELIAGLDDLTVDVEDGARVRVSCELGPKSDCGARAPRRYWPRADPQAA